MHLTFILVRILVLLFALFFLIMGMQWLVVPHTISDGFAVLPNGILGWATMRADFGSFFLVSGITMAVAASNFKGANHYLVCAVLLMAVASTGRIIGFLLDGIPVGGTTPFIFELAAIATLVALANLRLRLEKRISSKQ